MLLVTWRQRKAPWWGLVTGSFDFLLHILLLGNYIWLWEFIYNNGGVERTTGDIKVVFMMLS